MHRFAFTLLIVLLLLAGARAEDIPAGIQRLYDEASAAAQAGDHEEAVRLYYDGLEQLRGAGEGDTPDAGMFAAGVARGLVAMQDDRAAEAYRLAVHLLARSADARPFVATARQFINLLLEQRAHDEAVAVAEVLIARMRRPGVDDEMRAVIIEAALAAYGAAGRNAEADRVLAEAMKLKSDDPQIAYMRGLARTQVARDAEKAGRMAEMVAALDAGLADLRRAGDKGRGLLGSLLLLRGNMLFNEGDYRRALAAIEEAAPLLAVDPGAEDDWVRAVALRNRLLERVDRVQDALAGADGAIADFARRKGENDPLTVSARLDRVEILVRAGRLPAARAALEEVKSQLGGTADPLIAGYYFERLSAIEVADGHYVTAVQAAEEAIRIRRESYPDVEALLVSPMRLRALASSGLTDLSYSEQAHRELVELSERVFPANHPEVARDFNAFAAFLATFRRYGEAEAIERRAAAILQVAYGDGGAKYAFALQNLATFIMFNGKAEEAVGLIRQAIAIAAKLPDQEDFLGMTRINLASAEITLGRFADALATAQLAATLNAKLPVDAQKRLSSVHGLAMQALAGLKRPEEAIAEGRAMVTLLSQDTYEDAANRAIGLTRFAGVLVKSGPAADALSMARAALSATQSLSIAAGSDYREPAGIFVGAAWRAAAH
ncbi:hypothetical protein BH10PSE9_BH10PSE9_22200 [soil metagenome]